MSDITSYDFFNIYGISRYTAESPSYGGFLPIKIKTTKLYTDESNSDVDSAKPNIEFVLPFRMGEISDGVSVSYNRRGDNVMEGQVAQAMSEWVASLRITDSSITDSIAQVILAKYDPSTLNKKLEFDFILPAINTSTYNANMIQSVRDALGALQGMAYPRSFGLCYAPMVTVSIGGLYKNFKGFITDVSFRTSEELVNIGGEMFPLVINGSVKILNVFMYTWNEQFKNVIGSFNLKENPSLLFGFDSTTTSEVFGSGSSYGSATDNTISEDIQKSMVKSSDGADNILTVDEALETDGLENQLEEAALQEELNDNVKENFRQIVENSAISEADSWEALETSIDFNGMSSEIKNMNLSSMIADGEAVFTNFSKYANVLNSSIGNINSIINAGTLFNVNLDSLSGIASTMGNIQGIASRCLSSGTNLINDINKIADNGILDDIKSTFTLSKSAISDISNISSILNKTSYIGSALIGNSSTLLNINNVSHFYSNLNNFAKCTNISKNNVLENIAANVLTSQNSIKLINNTASIINATSKAVNPISTITTLGSINVITNLVSGLSDYKTSFKNNYDQASLLLSDGKMSYNEYYSIKQMYDASKNINIDYLTSVNNVLENKVKNIVDKII